MSTSEQIAQMVEVLPDSEQAFALEFVKRLVLAWDPDFTKATPAEAEAMRAGWESLGRGEHTLHEDIDWS